MVEPTNHFSWARWTSFVYHPNTNRAHSGQLLKLERNERSSQSWEETDYTLVNEMKFGEPINYAV